MPSSISSMPAMLHRVAPGVLPRQPVLRALLIAPAAENCEGLEAYFATSPEVELVSRTDSESGALQLFFLLQPDITILDWRVSVSEPARFVGLLKRVAPDARIMMLVPSHDSSPARAARVLGADAVVTADEAAACLDALVDAGAMAPAGWATATGW